MSSMTDIHQHFLWGMDDGAATPDVMKAMLRQAHQQGIRTVAATPHAAPGFSLFDMGQYKERLEEARSFCRLENLDLQLLPGAEVAWTYQTAMALRQGKLPTLGDSDYVLMEFWRDISWNTAADAVHQLSRAGFCPVLAHPERYLVFLLSPKGACRFRMETGALFQINASSCVSPRNWLQRRFVNYLLEERAVDAVASDAHDREIRPVNLAAARQWLAGKTDETYARDLTTFGGVFV